MSDLMFGRTVDGAPFGLPADVVTHTMAILAKKGAGKSYAAGVMEGRGKKLSARHPSCVVPFSRALAQLVVPSVSSLFKFSLSPSKLR